MEKTYNTKVSVFPLDAGKAKPFPLVLCPLKPLHVPQSTDHGVRTLWQMIREMMYENDKGSLAWLYVIQEEVCYVWCKVMPKSFIVIRGN